MKLRVNIIGLNEAAQTSLTSFIESLGHKVITSAIPESCHHHKHDRQKCLQKLPCCDALILGPDYIANHLPEKTDACKIAADSIAFMSSPWAGDQYKKKLQLDCHALSLPFECFEIHYWLSNVSNSRAYPAEEERNAVKKIL